MNKCRIRYSIDKTCIGEDEIVAELPKTIKDVAVVLDKANAIKLKLPSPSLEYACNQNPQDPYKATLTPADHHSVLNFKTLDGKTAWIEFIEI